MPAAFLAALREWASDPGALIYTVRGKSGSIAIFPEDVTGRTDDELLAFVRERLNEEAGCR
jgi:hypothetical protein